MKMREGRKSENPQMKIKVRGNTKITREGKKETFCKVQSDNRMIPSPSTAAVRCGPFVLVARKEIKGDEHRSRDGNDL